MNKSDSERIASVIEKYGLSPAPKKENADLIIINACSVRQSAMDRIYGQIRYLKLKNKKIKIFLTGCLLAKDKEKLRNKTDLIFKIKNLLKLSNFLNQKLKKQISDDYFQISPKYQNKFSAYIPIMTGCNNFCSYCVVPYVRGREYCRSPKKIIKEIKNLIKNGCKQIILLGQNVNSYKSKGVNFPKLLKMINDLKGDFWLAFFTSHPKDLSDELIKTMAKSKKINPYLHLPIQSGDNQILKKMNRKHTAENYENLIKKIRRKIPQIAISTDIIIGFPGETKNQFQNTAELMEKIKFDMAYLNKYSPRQQTAAFKLKDDVSQKEKKRRWAVLNEILKKTALENNQKLIGKTIEVLAEKNNFGRGFNFKDVQFKGDKKLIGKFVKIKITQANPWSLKGELI